MPFDIKAARKAGASDDQIRQFLSDRIDVAGAEKAGASLDQIAEFVSATPKKKEAPKSAIQYTPYEYKPGPLLPSESKPGYLQQLGEFGTKDLPDIGNRFVERTRASGQNIAAPTWAGTALGLSEKPLTIQGRQYDTRSTLGRLGEGIVSAPERAIRTGVGAASYGLDAAMMPVEAGLAGINRLAGGYPGRVLQRGVQAITPTVEKLAGTGVGKALLAQPTDPASQANLATTKRAAEVMAMLAAPGTSKSAIKVTKEGTKLAGKGVEATGRAYEEYGMKKVPSIIKAKSSLLEQIEGKDQVEKLKNFSQTIADYNLQGDLRNPGKLAEKAEVLGQKHVENADDQLKLVEFFGDKEIKPYDELKKRVGNVEEYAPFGRIPRYKKALTNLLNELESRGYGPGVSVPISKVKDIKKLVRPKVWKHGEIGDVLDPPMDDIQKRMTIAINEAASDIAPAAETFRYENQQAKKLFNISKIAKDDAYKELIKQQKKPIGDVVKAAVTGGAGLPGAILLKNLMGAGIQQPGPYAMLGGLGLVGLGGATVGAKAIMSPRVAIPVGRGVKNLGRIMQGEKAIVRPGKVKSSLPYDAERISKEEALKIIKKKPSMTEPRLLIIGGSYKLPPLIKRRP